MKLGVKLCIGNCPLNFLAIKLHRTEVIFGINSDFLAVAK